MIGPLSSQLNAIKWGEFRLGDLFEASNGDFDIQKRHINHKGEFVITAGLSNNGVLGQSDIKAKVFESHTITIDMFGCAFYRSFAYKMVTHARVFSLKPKFEINHKIGLFLSTLFFGYPKKFGYENMCSWAKIKNDKVILPLKPTAKTQTPENIDFTFMEKFIAELEQCRLAELEAYLKATGLENTTLSSDEENALNVFNNSYGGNTPCGLTWQSFRLGDLFEIYTGSLLSQEDLAKGDIVRISVKSDNNGVYGHFDTLKNKKARHFENFISVNFFGNCFYHPYLASVEMKVHVLKLKNRTLTKRIGLFLANQLNKCFYGQFTYGTQLSSSKLKHNNFKIQLPLKPTAKTQTLEDIDFNFMRTLINALMKQTIQGVVQYCGAKIQAAKEVINQETPVQKDSLF
ncbi:restriction endonuclease subunit S [Helicobacter pylori]|uniref:restriction endonuclease subunit S n=1 Tax=Helicobacter pylori TaxID=210 RepID=UPI001934255B|nr:restriction endonuclease subunit S [Helicobacter pylori]